MEHGTHFRYYLIMIIIINKIEESIFVMYNRIVVFVVTAMLLIGLTACSDGNDKTVATPSGSASTGTGSGNEANHSGSEEEPPAEKQAGETHIYKGPLGEVAVPVQPKKLLVMNTRYAEYLIEMGVKPQFVVFMPLLEPEYRADYFTSHGVELIEYPQYEQNYELLLNLGPDLILAQGLGMDEAVYGQLSKIAPTVALDSGPSMDEAMPLLAELFGKEAEYEQAKSAFDAKVAKAKAQLAEALGDQTVMVLRVEPNQYRYLGQHAKMGSSQLLYTQLGLNTPPYLADAPDWFTSLSAEVLPEVAPDYIFIEQRAAEGMDSTESWNQLMESSLWKGLKAVKEGKVFPLATNDFVQGEGPVGYSRLIDYIVSSLIPGSDGA